MKKFLREYFYIPESGKICEKVLLARINLSIAIIFLCLAAMAFSAYGYFAHENSAPTSIISAANYDLNIDAPDGVEPPVAEVYVLTNNTDAPKEFKFVLTRQEMPTAAKVGYCKIKIKTDVNGADYEDAQVFFTKPIGTFVENGTEVDMQSRRVVIIVAPNSTAMVTFIANLGSCASQEVVDNTITPQFLTPIVFVVFAPTPEPEQTPEVDNQTPPETDGEGEPDGEVTPEVSETPENPSTENESENELEALPGNENDPDSDLPSQDENEEPTE